MLYCRHERGREYLLRSCFFLDVFSFSAMTVSCGSKLSFSSTNKDLYEVAQLVVDGFDFERVEKVMQALEWKWATADGFIIPSVDRMKKVAFNTLIWAGRDKTVSSSGGFQARYVKTDDRETLHLEFIASRNYCVQYADGSPWTI